MGTKSDNTIGVLFGGRSSEHEISLRSAVFILKNIPEKYKIVPIAINREGVWRSLSGSYKSSDFNNITIKDLESIVAGNDYKNDLIVKNSAKNNETNYVAGTNQISCLLPVRKQVLSCYKQNFFRLLNEDINCIFPVLHGANGEDGRLQGLLELAEIAYVGCDLRSSAIGIDKDLQKRLAREAGIPVARYVVVDIEDFDDNANDVLIHIEKVLGEYPCFVKPNASGSAVGTGKAKNRKELLSALSNAFAFDQKVLVEELMIGTEVECAFLGTPSSPRVTIPGEIAPKDFYSYEEKYAADSEASLYIPARLSPEKTIELKHLAEKVAKICGIYGFSRIDFWNNTKTNSFYFNEYNSIPGLTSISMFPKLWEHEGTSGQEWIEELILKALMRQRLWNKTQYGIKAEI